MPEKPDKEKGSEKQARLLAEPFPREVIKRNPKGMDYIPVSEVIARLNRVLGTDRWSHTTLEIKEHGRIETLTGVYPKWLTAHVRVVLTFADGSQSSHDGLGGQSVEFLKGKNNEITSGPVDLGDSFKGAASDALKKAVQAAGVALDLARSEEAMVAEEHVRQIALEADEPKANEKTCAAIADHVKSLPDEERKAFVKWWNGRTGGKKLVGERAGLVTIREADDAMQHLGMGLPNGAEPQPVSA